MPRQRYSDRMVRAAIAAGHTTATALARVTGMHRSTAARRLAAIAAEQRAEERARRAQYPLLAQASRDAILARIAALTAQGLRERAEEWAA